ncbi:MAG TPA: CHRD domain-containing protein [Gaiellaceae bacterium]|nr:CHRD domain-containing protein [Gaiellaceae bacterium]
MLKVGRTYLVALLTLAALAVTGTALAAHNGNNKAELSGAGTGTAVVNYSKGQGTFNGTITVRGLMPSTEYSFHVSGAGAGTAGRLICSDTSDSSGTFTCSAQKLTLPGFTTAQVRTADGTVVASGVFERRGNCRDPEQAGSQCKAKS